MLRVHLCIRGLLQIRQLDRLIAVVVEMRLPPLPERLAPLVNLLLECLLVLAKLTRERCALKPAMPHLEQVKLLQQHLLDQPDRDRVQREDV